MAEGNPVTFARLRLLLLDGVVVFAAAWGAVSEFVSRWLPIGNLRRTDRVVIFPTAAWLREAADVWEIPIHGWVHRQGRVDSLRRGVINGLLRWLTVADDSAEGRLFRDRLGWFLVDNKRARRITVRVADQVHAFGPTDPQGHFHGMVQVAAAVAADLSRDGWLDVEVISSVHRARMFLGKVRLLAPTGLSVISDLDDTVKLTHVLNRHELLRNTFLRPFQAVPHMAEQYQQLVRRGAALHFVTCSPWHLFPTIEAFLDESGFPVATMICKRLRLKDSSLREFLSTSVSFKRPKILGLIDQFPRRRYLLIGDSGESDPEIYGQVARERPDQVIGVLVRRVPGDSSTQQRWAEAFRGLEAQRWQLFTEPGEIDWAKWC